MRKYRFITFSRENLRALQGPGQRRYPVWFSQPSKLDKRRLASRCRQLFNIFIYQTGHHILGILWTNTVASTSATVVVSRTSLEGSPASGQSVFYDESEINLGSILCNDNLNIEPNPSTSFSFTAFVFIWSRRIRDKKSMHVLFGDRVTLPRAILYYFEGMLKNPSGWRTDFVYNQFHLFRVDQCNVICYLRVPMFQTSKYHYIKRECISTVLGKYYVCMNTWFHCEGISPNFVKTVHLKTTQ